MILVLQFVEKYEDGVLGLAALEFAVDVAAASDGLARMKFLLG